MDDDEKVTRLPVRFKAPPSDDAPTLTVVSGRTGECDHRWLWRNGRMVNVTYQIREGETEVECGNCGTRLDPMWVLRRLATEETRWRESRKAYQAELARLNERTRTKCDHCGRMTRISRR